MLLPADIVRSRLPCLNAGAGCAPPWESVGAKGEGILLMRSMQRSSGQITASEEGRNKGSNVLTLMCRMS